MNSTLRDDLRDLAEQAPAVNLAERAVKGARRRRAVRLAVSAAAATALLAGGGGVLVAELRAEPPIVMIPPETTAPPLPAEGVGPLRHLYRTQRGDRVPPEKPSWRLVTRAGETYELRVDDGPLQVTADGRRIAYYSGERRAVVVRDLASGRIWTSPRRGAPDVTREPVLRLSPDGLRFVATGWSGAEPDALVDVERGTTTRLKRGWWPVSVADGAGPVVLARPFDSTTRVQVLGHDPITVDAFTYEFSALAPDGRTLARLGQSYDRDRTPMIQKDGTVVTFDALSGGGETRVPISGLAEGLRPTWLGAWLNDAELTVVATSPEPVRRAERPRAYALNVRTGATRELFTLPAESGVVMPGLVR
ncbi:hypothetical protein HII36_23715 [Nonomuraea sp. NN258]|uniref:hypothetical protein n=1 Tax=Nonomuraea antri TaxID=2730852 RepID=UPI0015682852|nr:hypothetical protein [Nonomuraea antri]NRQ34818.1 hypothetical protein [Nonomuraea antri]